VLFVCDEFGTAAGGIASFNMVLCIKLADTYKDLRVLCSVVRRNKTPEAVAEATAAGVELVTTPGTVAADSMESLYSGLEIPDLDPRDVLAVLGHAHITGPHARHLRKQYFPAARLGMFLHTLPDEFDQLKRVFSLSKTSLLQYSLLDMCADCDDLFCVGDKIYSSTKGQVRNLDSDRKPVVHLFLPPVSLAIVNRRALHPPDSEDEIRVLFLGRAELNIFDAKGLGILAAALALIQAERARAGIYEPNLRLIIVGAGEAEHADLQDAIRKACGELAAEPSFRMRFTSLHRRAA
jgi:hypothetical protein